MHGKVGKIGVDPMIIPITLSSDALCPVDIAPLVLVHHDLIVPFAYLLIIFSYKNEKINFYLKIIIIFTY